jgi:uncharacterized protein
LYREENGPYPSRAALKKVPKLGAKAFEQCAGFLRVPESKNYLDHTGVHPESYAAAKGLLEILGYKESELQRGAAPDLPNRLKTSAGEDMLAAQLSVGLPTLHDICAELTRPGRDPRDELPPPLLRTEALKLEDLLPGMELTGTVRNVIDFGAFVDVGVHQDGLVHISRMSKKYIKHPSEVLKVGQIIKVYVLGVDAKKQRISLTLFAEDRK